MLQQSVARKGLAGFFLNGLHLSFLSAILPAWRYHIEPNFALIGFYFLCQNLGLVAGIFTGHRLLPQRGVRFSMILACGLACVSFLLLAAFSPPSEPWLRMLGLTLLGYSAGLLNTASFNAITPLYEQDTPATLNIAGTLFGLGCFLSALLVAGTFFVYTVASIVALIALIPGFAAGLYVRYPLPSAVFRQEPGWPEVRKQFRSPAAVLLALLLFFQFGNEWSVAGWLPLFLTLRLGMSPETALFYLALYWMVLLVGRLAAQWILPRISHNRLLAAAVVAPMFGCLVLLFTNNELGVVTGILLTASGFSVIYPLAAEKIGHRYPGFNPGFFNGIFSFAGTGALLAPASLGFFAAWLGIGAVMALPLAGSILVVVLLLLNLLESKLSGTPDA